MRKIAIALSVFGAILMGTVTYAASGRTAVAEKSDNWIKDADQAWEGKKNGTNYWYKLEATKLMWSTDGKKWEIDADGLWSDNFGHWLKISGGKLVWSNDSGKTWEEVKEWRWQGSDSKWYKFDKDFTLWVAK